MTLLPCNPLCPYAMSALASDASSALCVTVLALGSIESWNHLEKMLSNRPRTQAGAPKPYHVPCLRTKAV